MPLTVKSPRQIIVRKTLARALALIADAEDDLTRPQVRQRILTLFKDALESGRVEVRRRFEAREAGGAETLRANAYLLDQLIRALHEFAILRIVPLNPADIAVVATGGYGRAEMAPFSDLDIMFLTAVKPSQAGRAVINSVVEWMLYMLWDLGLKVGHATRTVGEAVELAKGDVTICTSLLEARWISGEHSLFDSLRKRFASEVIKGSEAQFVKAKLDERDTRHERMGDSRYVLEPNIKDGKGGLRDLQTLMWIAKYIYHVDTVAQLIDKGVLDKVDARRFLKAQKFLWALRCHLHYLAGRPEETLSFNIQGDLAQRMGYTDHAGATGVERFMKHYFLVARDVGDLTRVICAVLEHQHAKKARIQLPSFNFRRKLSPGFGVDAGRLTVDGADVFVKDPVNLLRLFAEADHYGLDIHPEALRLVQRNLKLIGKRVQEDAQANALFLDMLMSDKGPRLVLGRLNESGVFGRFVPDFARVTGQMQYDMYHVYTVDEHTIHAIDILSRIERGLLAQDHPLSTRVFKDIQSRRVLYVAVLLHDIAKGRGGDHSVVGAEIAKKLCPRLGLDEWETETVSWLVLQHLLMSRTAFKRDVDDSKTIRDFVAQVQSPERLRLLLILTVADIRAVGPNVWNAWKASLLRELYYGAQEAMTGGLPAQRREARADHVRGQVVEKLKGWASGDVDWFLEQCNADYFLAYDADTIARHADMVIKAHKDGIHLVLEAHTLDDIDVTEVMIHTQDHPGLFAAIAGAMSLSGANVVDAKITTLGNGMALDTFWVQDVEDQAFRGEERIQRLKDRIVAALTGRIRAARELDDQRKRQLPSRMRVFEVPPQVFVNNEASVHSTVIEVNGRNRLGFLHDVTRALTDFGLQITSAHISTYGERVVDVFYVRDVFGLKVDQELKIKTLTAKLMAAIGDARGEKQSA